LKIQIWYWIRIKVIYFVLFEFYTFSFTALMFTLNFFSVFPYDNYWCIWNCILSSFPSRNKACSNLFWLIRCHVPTTFGNTVPKAAAPGTISSFRECPLSIPPIYLWLLPMLWAWALFLLQWAQYSWPSQICYVINQ